MHVYISVLMSVSETCLLDTWHPALRRQERGQGQSMERENLMLDVKRDGEDGSPVSQEYQCQLSGADVSVVALRQL